MWGATPPITWGRSGAAAWVARWRHGWSPDWMRRDGGRQSCNCRPARGATRSRGRWSREAPGSSPSCSARSPWRCWCGRSNAMTVLRVWAPLADRVAAVVGGAPSPMARAEGGWWTGPDVAAGTDYGFSVDGRDPRPDPRSRWQPRGVHGPSRIVDDDAFAWTDADWHGRPVLGGVVYELHVGTFTPEGTFDAAIARLNHLVELGIAAVEVLPLAAFPGRHGWGYDGVALYAVHDPYGGPDGFKRFVGAAHTRGLAVLVDAVYNPLGPNGNFLGEFGPYFTTKHTAPWGSAVNFD